MIATALVVLCIAGAKSDPLCTPGRVLPHVTASQVCTPGWAGDHRHVTLEMRHRVFARYGIPYVQHSRFQLDHFLSLEIGGSNGVQNLWPQPLGLAHVKDQYEDLLHRRVCDGEITLRCSWALMRARWLRKAH